MNARESLANSESFLNAEQREQVKSLQTGTWVGFFKNALIKSGSHQEVLNSISQYGKKNKTSATFFKISCLNEPPVELDGPSLEGERVSDPKLTAEQKERIKYLPEGTFVAFYENALIAHDNEQQKMYEKAIKHITDINGSLKHLTIHQVRPVQAAEDNTLSFKPNI